MNIKLVINSDKLKFFRKIFGLKNNQEKMIKSYQEKIGQFYLRWLTKEELYNLDLLKNLNAFLLINSKENDDNLQKEYLYLKWRKQYVKF